MYEVEVDVYNSNWELGLQCFRQETIQYTFKTTRVTKTYCSCQTYFEQKRIREHGKNIDQCRQYSFTHWQDIDPIAVGLIISTLRVSYGPSSSIREQEARCTETCFSLRHDSVHFAVTVDLPVGSADASEHVTRSGFVLATRGSCPKLCPVDSQRVEYGIFKMREYFPPP